MIISPGGSRARFAGGLRVLLVFVLLGLALASERAAGEAIMSPGDDAPYPSECTSDCLFRIGVAYCKFDSQDPGITREDTGLTCYDMGKPVRVTTFTGKVKIKHRGYARMSTVDSNSVLLSRGLFDLPYGTRPSQYQAVSRFHYGDYNCSRFGDGARCTIPSERYPGSLLAIFLTKRGGVWYRRIPA